MWTVNFTSVFPRFCTDDDYYTWNPWDEVGVTLSCFGVYCVLMCVLCADVCIAADLCIVC